MDNGDPDRSFESLLIEAKCAFPAVKHSCRPRFCCRTTQILSPDWPFEIMDGVTDLQANNIQMCCEAGRYSCSLHCLCNCSICCATSWICFAVPSLCRPWS